MKVKTTKPEGWDAMLEDQAKASRAFKGMTARTVKSTREWRAFKIAGFMKRLERR